MTDPRPRATSFVTALALTMLVTGCQWGPIDLPSPHGWREFHEPGLEVTLEVPDDYAIRLVRDGVDFVVQDVGTAAVLRPATTVDEERHHFGVDYTPLSPVMVGGTPAEHFRYRHNRRAGLLRHRRLRDPARRPARRARVPHHPRRGGETPHAGEPALHRLGREPVRQATPVARPPPNRQPSTRLTARRVAGPVTAPTRVAPLSPR